MLSIDAEFNFRKKRQIGQNVVLNESDDFVHKLLSFPHSIGSSFTHIGTRSGAYKLYYIL